MNTDWTKLALILEEIGARIAALKGGDPQVTPGK